MNCAISGEIPEEPVVSVKTGHVFEKRLIHKHIDQTGMCPVTKQELTKEDLVPIVVNKISRPRPPSAASVPGVLKILQSEWDALMLETYTLKQHLNATREELARVMYQHDAACRVIARLMKERDQARDAVGNVQANLKAAVNEDTAMEVDESGSLPAEVLKTMQAAAKKLSKPRKKRIKARQSEVAKPAALAKYKATSSNPLHSASKPGVLCLAVHPTNSDVVLTGGADSNAILFNRESSKITSTLKGHKKKVVDVQFHPSEPILYTASADGTAKIWNAPDGKYDAAQTLSHGKGAVVGCSVHPSGDYLVTASAQGSWHFYDARSGSHHVSVEEPESSGFTTVQFHPDGLILGLGTNDNRVSIYDIKQQKNVCSFSEGHKSSISALAFSENGYYLASADGGGVVKLWDLRKLADFHTINPEDNSGVDALQFDASGSYLAVGGSSLRLFRTKPWELVKSFSDHSKAITGVAFGPNAAFIASTSMDRTLKIYS